MLIFITIYVCLASEYEQIKKIEPGKFLKFG